MSAKWRDLDHRRVRACAADSCSACLGRSVRRRDNRHCACTSDTDQRMGTLNGITAEFRMSFGATYLNVESARKEFNGEAR
jgi:hypothetical protein